MNYPNYLPCRDAIHRVFSQGCFARSKVFVKRVPVTNIEFDNLFSTRNLYNLPTYCNYGFGSTGFGVFRELVTHIKTTNWVLSGAIATFPLMYHYRIIPFSGRRVDVDMERLKDYVLNIIVIINKNLYMSNSY